MNKNNYEMQKIEKENSKISNGTKIGFWFVASIHVGLAVFACVRYKFPVLYWYSFIFLILTVLPSGIIVYILIKNKKTLGRIIMLILCVCYLPVSLILSFRAFDCSRTYAIKNYLNMDRQLSQVEKLFPETLPTSYNESQSNGSKNDDAKYYYYYTGGSYYAYDVYAEFTLTKDEFSKEMERIGALYDEFEIVYGSEVVFEMQYGDYKCFIATNSPHELFVDVEHDYIYIIFAYDEQNLRVRYAVCANLDPDKIHQPYYLQLDW